MRYVSIAVIFLFNFLLPTTTFATLASPSDTEQLAPPLLHITWTQFHQDVKELAALLKTKAPKEGWKSIVAITRGGLVPAGILSHELKIKQIDTIGFGSYHNKEKKSLTVFKPFASHEKNIIVVDELSDSGGTMKAAQKYIPNAYRVVVYTKPEGKDAVNLFVKEIPQNVWVVFPWEVDD